MWPDRRVLDLDLESELLVIDRDLDLDLDIDLEPDLDLVALWRALELLQYLFTLDSRELDLDLNTSRDISSKFLSHLRDLRLVFRLVLYVSRSREDDLYSLEFDLDRVFLERLIGSSSESES